MEVKILKQVVREIEGESDVLKQDVFGALERLSQGELIGMPMSRPLPSIAKGLHELRFSDKRGEFRVFYYIKLRDAIYVIHAMRKKKQGIDQKTKGLLQFRIRSLG